MSRTKQERITITTEGISGKSLKNGEYAWWGPEPKWERSNPLLTEAEFLEEADRKFGAALNWYNAMSDIDKVVGYLWEYVEKNHPTLLSDMKRVFANATNFHGLLNAQFKSHGAIVRMLSRGAELNPKYTEGIDDWIKATAKLAKQLPDEKRAMKKFTQADPKVAQCCCLADEEIDIFFATKKFKSKCLADLILGDGASIAQLHKVGEHFITLYTDLLDPEIASEAYHLKPKETKAVIAWLSDEASEDLVIVAPVKTRKPRKKKKKTPAQLLKHFVFKASDPDLNIESVDPEDIFGATQLWVFNVEKRRLGVFHAKEGGLTVTRRSIDNYDEETSVSKKLRKPGEIVPSIRGLGKVQLRKVLDGVNAVAAPMRSRISEDTLLLRVV
jgi:hypothetical protein